MNKGIILWAAISVLFAILFAVSALLFMLDYREYDKGKNSGIELMTIYSRHSQKADEIIEKDSRLFSEYMVHGSADALHAYMRNMIRGSMALEAFERFVLQNEDELAGIAVDTSRSKAKIMRARSRMLENLARIDHDVRDALRSQAFNADEKKEIMKMLSRAS